MFVYFFSDALSDCSTPSNCFTSGCKWRNIKQLLTGYIHGLSFTDLEGVIQLHVFWSSAKVKLLGYGVAFFPLPIHKTFLPLRIPTMYWVIQYKHTHAPASSPDPFPALQHTIKKQGMDLGTRLLMPINSQPTQAQLD